MLLTRWSWLSVSSASAGVEEEWRRSRSSLWSRPGWHGNPLPLGQPSLSEPNNSTYTYYVSGHILNLCALTSMVSLTEDWLAGNVKEKLFTW